MLTEILGGNEKRARGALHRDKMALINAVHDTIDKTLTGKLPERDVRVLAIREMSASQKVNLLRKLEERRAYWSQYPAPLEQSMVDKAVEEFNEGNYRHASIYRYISARDIDEAMKR